MSDLTQIKDHVLTILQRVKDQLRANCDFQQVQTKSERTDLVTERDKQIEQQIIAYLSTHFPQAKFVSEEGYGDRVTDLTGLIFFVDPIDGTMNFVKSHDQFASMIGVFEDGKPLFGAIVDIMQDQIFYGGPEIGAYVDDQELSVIDDSALASGLITISNRLLWKENQRYLPLVQASSGLRIFGSAGIIFTRLLQSKEVLYISQLKPWDLAAGLAIGAGIGLTVSNIDGNPVNMLQSQTVIIGTKCASIEARKLLS